MRTPRFGVPYRWFSAGAVPTLAVLYFVLRTHEVAVRVQTIGWHAHSVVIQQVTNVRRGLVPPADAFNVTDGLDGNPPAHTYRYSTHVYREVDEFDTPGTSHDETDPNVGFVGRDFTVKTTHTYVVRFQGPDGVIEVTPTSQADFSRYVVGDRWVAVTSRLGGTQILRPDP